MLGPDHTGAREFAGPRRSCNRRMTPIGAGAQRRVAACGLLLLPLRRYCCEMMFMRRRQLGRSWPGLNATVAAVEADAIHRDIVDHGLVVHIGDVLRADV